ncbi:LPS-assembly protein LptD, partial [Candidatus Desantisbacteria bacterium]|nr:LPS-assembly protein LptD [Candidatus Desantisbacteria bacterium]
MKKTIKSFIIYALLFFIPYSVYAMDLNDSTNTIRISSSLDSINITGDYLEYISSQKKIIGKGNIILEQNSKKISADEIEFDVATNIIVAVGNVSFIEGNTEFKGEKVVYDTKKLTGIFEKSSIYNKPWFFKTSKFEKLEKKILKTQDDIVMTSCDLPNPHYDFTAKKMIVYLDDRVVAYDVVFHIGEIPFFYLPIYYYSLKYSPFYFKPGYNTKYGWLFNSKIHFTTPPYVYGSFIFDGWQRRGYGKGVEWNYYVDDNRRGTLYFYGIDEKPVLFDSTKGRYYSPSVEEPVKRWKSQVYFTHELQPKLTAKMNYERISYPDFKWDYEDIRERRLSEDLNFTLLKTEDTYNASLYFSEINNWNESKQRYAENTKTIPEVKLDFLKRPIWDINKYTIYYKLDLLYANTLYENYYNSYSGVTAIDYYLSNAYIAQALMTSFYPFPRTSLSPTIRYNEYWYSSHDPVKSEDRIYGTYGTQLVLTNNFTRNLWNEL